MITIFCDFCQFSAKKLAFFLTANVMIKFMRKLALSRVKNANFFAIFLANNFQNHNIGPWKPETVFFRCSCRILAFTPSITSRPGGDTEAVGRT
jgi:hypothetical protein